MMDEMEKASKYGAQTNTDQQSHKLTSHKIYKPPTYERYY